MSKSKSQKKRKWKNKNKTKQSKQNVSIKSKTPQTKRLKNIFWVFLALLGGVAAYFSLLPDISSEALKPLKRGNLATCPMNITNNGFLPIYDVSYVCKARELINEKGGKIIACNKGISPRNFVIEKLDRNETTTTGLPFTFVAGQIVSADFDFVIIYKPFWFSPFTLKKAFRFASAANDKGDIFLLHRSISEK